MVSAKAVLCLIQEQTRCTLFSGKLDFGGVSDSCSKGSSFCVHFFEPLSEFLHPERVWFESTVLGADERTRPPALKRCSQKPGLQIP